MEISIYSIVVVFVVAPFLLFRYTDIPDWFFRRARNVNAKWLIFFAALVLLLFSVGIAVNSDSVWSVRILSVGVAGLACLCHYFYSKSSKSEASEDEK